MRSRNASARGGPRRPRPPSPPVLLLGGLLLGLPLAGCSGRQGTHGREGALSASYALGRLRAELPERVPVPAVVAAAESTLREGGYAIRESSSTEVGGRVEAVPPERGFFERVVVRSETGRWGTRITVRVEPLGDEPRARTILDGILLRLGR